jgi:hypothetical protein
MADAVSAELPAEEYVGPAVVSASASADGEVDVEVEVRLRGQFEPLDGRFHWYGRVSPSPELAEVRPGSTVTLRTPHGSASGRLADRDPWGRFRISGTGRPPY